MTNDAISPVIENTTKLGNDINNMAQGTWSCECGEKNLKGNFCFNCGRQKPIIVETWECECGEKENKGKFCSNCGKLKPEKKWNCKCGRTGITGNFCDNCGSKRGE